MQEIAQWTIASQRRRFVEHDLPDIDGQVVVRVDVLGQSRDFRAKRRLVVRVTAVAVKLNVRQMTTVSFQSFHCLVRCDVIARQTEVVAVQMHGMWQLQFVDSPSESSNDVSRCHIKRVDFRIERRGIAEPALPVLDTTGVHQLGRVAFRGIEQPGHTGP